MRVRVLTVIALAVLLGIGVFAQQAPRKPASPPGTAATQASGQWAKATPDAAEPRYVGGKWIDVTYGRPVLRGRKDIFGTGADYGKTVKRNHVDLARGRERHHPPHHPDPARHRRQDHPARRLQPLRRPQA